MTDGRSRQRSAENTRTPMPQPLSWICSIFKPPSLHVTVILPTARQGTRPRQQLVSETSIFAAQASCRQALVHTAAANGHFQRGFTTGNKTKHQLKRPRPRTAERARRGPHSGNSIAFGERSLPRQTTP